MADATAPYCASAATPHTNAAHARSLRYGAPAALVDPLLSLLFDLHAMQERVLATLSVMGVERASLPRPFANVDGTVLCHSARPDACVPGELPTPTAPAAAAVAARDGSDDDADVSSDDEDALVQYAALRLCAHDMVLSPHAVRRMRSSEREAHVHAAVDAVLRWLEAMRPLSDTTDSDAAQSRRVLSAFIANVHGGDSKSGGQSDGGGDAVAGSRLPCIAAVADSVALTGSGGGGATTAMEALQAASATMTTTTTTSARVLSPTTPLRATRKRARHVCTVVQPGAAPMSSSSSGLHCPQQQQELHMTQTSTAAVLCDAETATLRDASAHGEARWQCVAEFTSAQAAQMTRQWAHYARCLREVARPLRGTLRAVCASSLGALSRSARYVDTHVKWIERGDAAGHTHALATPACLAVARNSRRRIELHDALATYQVAMREALMRAEEAMEVYMEQAEVLCAQEHAYWRGVQVLERELQALCALRVDVRRVRADVLYITGQQECELRQRRRRRKERRQQRYQEQLRQRSACDDDDDDASNNTADAATRAGDAS